MTGSVPAVSRWTNPTTSSARANSGAPDKPPAPIASTVAASAALGQVADPREVA